MREVEVSYMAPATTIGWTRQGRILSTSGTTSTIQFFCRKDETFRLNGESGVSDSSFTTNVWYQLMTALHIRASCLNTMCDTFKIVSMYSFCCKQLVRFQQVCASGTVSVSPLRARTSPMH